MLQIKKYAGDKALKDTFWGGGQKRTKKLSRILFEWRLRIRKRKILLMYSKLRYKEQLGTAELLLLLLGFVITGLIYELKRPFGTEKFVCYNRVFDIT